MNIKKNGLINKKDYEGYIKKMGIGNNLLNITYEHKYKVLEPEYRIRNLEEIIEEQNKAYQGSNIYHYREVVTKKPQVDDPINNANLNIETNESILEKAKDIPADPNHRHNDECYLGTKHVHGSSCPKTYHPVAKTLIDSSTDYEYHRGCGGTLYYYAYLEQCNQCGAYFQYSQTGCSGNCGTFAWSNAGGCSCTGYYTYSCDKREGKYYDNNGKEVAASCGLMIVSLTPTHPNQTVYINDTILTTAVATYKDGSSKTLLCTTDFSAKNLGKDQTASLSYNYELGGNSYIKKCRVTVNVIPRNKRCSKDHIYNINEDGSDPGCPYCKAWLESLRIIYPNTSSIIITIGTSLQENGIRLLATYMDGHTEEVTSGYIDNLDTAYLGTMPVTIGYKGETVSLLVTTVPKTMKCEICEYEYNLYPDGTNPGCPRCIQKIPIFTGKVMEYERINYTDEILSTLYEKGQYNLNVDDIFSIQVTNKSSNLIRELLKKIFPSLSNRWIYISKSENILTK